MLRSHIAKTALFVILSNAVLHAVELRVGNGNFSWEMGINNFMKSDVDLNIFTVSLNEQHSNFNDSSMYYFFSADFYGSKTFDKVTQFASIPVTTNLPFYGGSISDMADQYTKIPVPSEYKIRGFDLNLGLGYDLYKKNNDFFGVGINTGLSMPVMKMRNYIESAEAVYALFYVTDTTLMTYKLGPALQFNYEFVPSVSLYGYASYGIQHGDMKNDWFLSSMNVDGRYSVVDIGVKYMPYKGSYDLGWFSVNPDLFITFGFTYKNWEVDDINVNLSPLFHADVSGMLTHKNSMHNVYFGIGYHF